MSMREDLKAFIDNEVTDSERTQILRDVDSNPELQAEVIELRQISRMIREEAWQPEPVGLERTLAALRTGEKRHPWWMTPVFQATVAAAGSVLLIAILFPVFAQRKSGAEIGPTASTAANAPAEISSDGQFRSRNGSLEMDAKAKVEDKRQAQEPVALDVAPGGSTPTFSGPRFEIKTAQLAVEVENVPKAQQEAEGIARGVGGRVQSSSKNDNEGVLASAELTLRVPVRSFETALNRLRALGRVERDSITGDDVTTQVVDVEARLKVMRAEEDQYIELLKSTNKVGEVLSVKERLSQVRQEIESLDAQRRALRDQSAESTVHLSLTERPKADRPRENQNWAEDAWSRAVSGLSSAGRALGSAAVFLFVFSPIWLPIGLLVWWFARKNRG